MNVLQLKSSILGSASVSSRLADEFVALLAEQNSNVKVVVRDLAVEAVPHLDGARVAAFFAKDSERTEAQREIVGYSDALIAELRRADVLVLGLPMYNFGVPSQLKAWFDHLARSGETFKYTEQGSVGLMKGKKAYVFAARGGVYGGEVHPQTQFVRQFLEFIGISEVEFIYAEGLAIGPDSRNKSIAAARASARSLALQTRLAA